ncbi:hypothetical protein P19_0145 [Aeromonas phage P19]|nr:hypothetical protein P19_0145 [Aeromonas phage P19]
MRIYFIDNIPYVVENADGDVSDYAELRCRLDRFTMSSNYVVDYKDDIFVFIKNRYSSEKIVLFSFDSVVEYIQQFEEEPVSKFTRMVGFEDTPKIINEYRKKFTFKPNVTSIYYKSDRHRVEFMRDHRNIGWLTAIDNFVMDGQVCKICDDGSVNFVDVKTETTYSMRKDTLEKYFTQIM